jgi:hypothetical protein
VKDPPGSPQAKISPAQLSLRFKPSVVTPDVLWAGSLLHGVGRWI